MRDLYSILWSFIICDRHVGVASAKNSVACAQIGVKVGHLELCGARGKLGVVAPLCIGYICRLVSLYLCHNVVLYANIILWVLTVIVVEFSAFIFEIDYWCMLDNFNRVAM
jgi:hypothetical protein